MTDHQTSPAGEDAERAEFKAWYVKEVGESRSFMLGRNSNGEYAYAETESMWMAWQAATARRAAPALDASGLPRVKTWGERMTAEGLYDLNGRLFAGWTGEMMARDAEAIELRKQVNDLRAQLASERQAKEYEQRHAVESETALAQVQAELVAARQVGKHLFDAVADGAAPTQPKAQVGSIDTPEFRALVRKLLTDHNQMINGPAGTALIAHIDAWAGSRAGDAVPAK